MDKVGQNGKLDTMKSYTKWKVGPKKKWKVGQIKKNGQNRTKWKSWTNEKNWQF